MLSVHAAEDYYVYELPLDLDATSVADSGLDLWLSTSDVARLSARLDGTTVGVGPQSDAALKVTLSGRDKLRSAPEGRHLAATFLVDFNDPAVRTLVQEGGSPGEGLAAVKRLTEFTNASIGTTPYSRGFDAASIVARDRVGDCTEHAIVLTALARANTLPARTVLGALVLVGGTRSGAYGHAWTEIWVDGEWRLADATLPERNFDGSVYYLPVGALGDEGMGYAMDLFGLITAMPTSLHSTAEAAHGRQGHSAFPSP